jgi:putative thioredoxin
VSIDVTDATLVAEVIERSETVPVVVDLWAPWCGPCQTLGPLLEKVVDEYDGKVVLAKINVDENPQASQQFRVQGIPAVYGFRDGKNVDGFVGARDERGVREFIERLVPSEADNELTQLVAAGDEASLRAALELQADHAGAIVALATLLIQDDKADEALQLLARIPETAETRRVAALARTGGQPDDIPSQLEALLPTVKDDEDARKRFLDLLEVLGPDDPRTADYRKRLTSQLF